MTFAETMIAKAVAAHKRLVLPEGTEPRTLQAARKIVDQKIASSVTLVGNVEQVKAAASAIGVDVSDMQIVDPATSPDLDKYANEYYELRKKKGGSCPAHPNRGL